MKARALQKLQVLQEFGIFLKVLIKRVASGQLDASTLNSLLAPMICGSIVSAD